MQNVQANSSENVKINKIEVIQNVTSLVQDGKNTTTQKVETKNATKVESKNLTNLKSEKIETKNNTSNIQKN